MDHHWVCRGTRCVIFLNKTPEDIALNCPLTFQACVPGTMSGSDMLARIEKYVDSTLAESYQQRLNGPKELVRVPCPYGLNRSHILLERRKND